MRWEPSSQPELLWDIIAGRSELVSAEELDAIHVAVPSPPLSQEHISAVQSAVTTLPVPVVDQSILAMESVLSQSQGVEPDVTQIPLKLLDALRKIVPSLASRLLEQLARTASFQMARESGSKGSSPMDISPPPGQLSVVPVHCFIAPGDNPDLPIILSSDSDSGQVVTRTGVASNTGVECVSHTSASTDSSEYERPSDHYISTASEGHNLAHAISITPTSSSLHSSDQISVPDMGPIARGGCMQDKAGREATARERKLNSDLLAKHITDTALLIPFPDRDLTPPLSMLDDQVNLDHQNVMVSRSLLMVGLAVDQLVDNQLAAEANRTAICTVGELNDARLGYSHYFLREPITLLDEACMSIESPVLRCMLDVVGDVLSTGPHWSADLD
jgi:hypothetical protein